MNAKILLIALSAAAFTSCSTAYKSVQTPDDVYYSPARAADENRDGSRKNVYNREWTQYYSADDSRTMMTIRDRRWRDLNDEYDYNYRNSPYNYSYCNCSCNNYGYYYNPYYYSRPLYSTTAYYKPAVNSTPRMVNLNSYTNYSAAVANDPKTGNSYNYGPRGTRVYNNSNESRAGRVVREIFTPSSNSNNNSNSPSSNNTRTYTPSTPSSSPSSSGSSSSGSSSSGSVSRPGRG